MALRVLLADESTTIRKVMQLALQDFAVEVKSVHSGLDVLEVARQFVPDIIFADVLLQKRNGYEVSADLKKDAGLRATPVVLMWSSFMDLDEKQAQASGCDRRLEKPFDVENLRQLVLELVPKTRSQRLAHFLKFPANVTEPLKAEIEQKSESAAKRESAPAVIAMPPARPLEPTAEDASLTPLELTQSPATASTPDAPKASTWNMESFEGIDSFSSDAGVAADDEPFRELRIKTPPAKPEFSLDSFDHEPEPLEDLHGEKIGAIDDRDPWSHQDLSRFKLELPVKGDDDDLEYELPEDADRPHEAQTEIVHRDSGNDVEMISMSDEHAIPMIELEDLPTDLDAETLEIEGDHVDEDTEKIRSPGRLSDREVASASGHDELLGFEGGRIPQLSPERLEEIIRAQSREIIESVVRRVVPDLATDMIRRELERLLDEDDEDHDPARGRPAKPTGKSSSRERL